MKIQLIDPSTQHVDADMYIKGQEVMLEGVYAGVGIKTDQGLIGICERDGGVEVLLDGDLIFASYSDAGRLEQIHALTTSLHNMLEDGEARKMVEAINELVPGWVKAKAEPTDTKTESPG